METIAVERSIWIDPPRQFTLRWQPQQPGVLLSTTFLLAAENGGTRTMLFEAGYETIPADQRQAWFHKAGEGYTMSMENLRAFVEGRSLPS